MTDRPIFPLTAAHWGVYRAEVEDGRLKALHPFEHDPDPSPIGQGYLGVLDDPLRIKAPMVRKAWLENGPGAASDRNGDDAFVRVSWETAEQLVADELRRVCADFGNQAIFGGSYGWSSAGRFHHAQSQLHRFLNCVGGYTRSVNSYSLAAGEVILSHVLGGDARFIHAPTPWQSVVEHTDLLVAFGGMPLRNAQISSGGTGRHRAREALEQAKRAGVSFVNISPIRSDVADDLMAQWLPARPGTDVAIMLGLAHELVRNDWHDAAFLDRYTTGFDKFADYLTGKADGIAKTAEWAAGIADLPAGTLEELAMRMARSRTVISVSWALTRQEHGEQPFWMATTLAAMLGQIGLPGGGVAFGYCAANSIGNERRPVSYAALPQLENPVKDFIPVARIADMLLNPGAEFQFNGQSLTYPDIRLVYWAGGNPFHHHQDLTRLCAAWQKPETVIVHDWCWNTLAKRADIVLPCTTPLERDDIMLTPRDRFIVRMKTVVPPIGAARSDHDIFRAIGRRMGVEHQFTEGRSTDEWLEWLYQESRHRACKAGIDLPDYPSFCEMGWYETPPPAGSADAFSAFRNDPDGAPLNTPSGRIEIVSSAIASFKSASVLPHPAWHEPEEWLGNAGDSFPFHLISSQPPDKLHSQLDHGPVSKSEKRNGRSPIRMHPSDAKVLGIAEGDTVRVYNARGACLATAKRDNDLLQGVVQMSTGAWLDAVRQDDGTLLCRHGNPNTVTRDRGTSELAQGPTAHSCLVAIERHEESGPIEAFLPPIIE
ncbi:molybdopterin guanine dinucleotide-containing S/N-oxide reductase [Maritimibacter sp. HL-12]|uniref:molybdopterin guanine dinucleotide-containing S/N-oxide reductase n=1 Tax=Maritimibacter sp. HL-12 TaxID=1162418 RepID=UPI000A0F24D5|nr:molybdopterin guanine dinucleotide-containing S/N-oxide reductase [Maritimibacter sp. HL-12]SMH40072.1 biotin/methionine sulfoxide reductase [Maritimibacter sp. HL-12]